jgi:hypothetical protein
MLIVECGTIISVGDVAMTNNVAAATAADAEPWAILSLEPGRQMTKAAPPMTWDDSSCQRFYNTRKYHPACMPRPAELYPLLVTGLGGSGTHDLAIRLRAQGCRVAHEEIQSDGAVSWFYAVNDVVAQTQYPHHAKLMNPASTSPRFSYVYHLVRCPLQQISSFTTHLNASYDFIRKHMLYQIKNPAAAKGVNTEREPSSANKHSSRRRRQRDHAVDDAISNVSESSVWAVRNLRQFFRKRLWQVRRVQQ